MSVVYGMEMIKCFQQTTDVHGFTYAADTFMVISDWLEISKHVFNMSEGDVPTFDVLFDQSRSSYNPHDNKIKFGLAIHWEDIFEWAVTSVHEMNHAERWNREYKKGRRDRFDANSVDAFGRVIDEGLAQAAVEEILVDAYPIQMSVKNVISAENVPYLDNGLLELLSLAGESRSVCGEFLDRDFIAPNVSCKSWGYEIGQYVVQSFAAYEDLSPNELLDVPAEDFKDFIENQL